MEKLQNNIGFLIFTALIFFGGMKFEQYRNDSSALDQEKKQQEIEIERAKAADEVAQKVLTGLTNWKKNTETIYKEMHYEKTKPVFYNVCASDEYVSLFNQRQEEAKRVLKSKE
ncbi:hypothetical protein [Escherichia phage EK010]|uniref:I-spanin n=1 Tax=Escherichia phage EK010 TaxID=2742112 RepID=A0A6J4EFV3_9CAUD|nr:Rz-like spanin [Escherichia phage EK010]UYE89940.1 hypothetical protein [Escherichia phage E20-1]BCG45010.1 hypothetical protein [Escherichia phage EK010]